MASINALLKINEVGNEVMDSVISNVETNNISILPYTTNLTSWFVNQTSGNRDYQGAIVNTINGSNTSKYGSAKYGAKKVSDNQYVSQYNGLMFKDPNDLTEDFKITIVGVDILSFNIWFDESMGQRPLEYTVYSSISGETNTFTTQDNIVRISGLLSGYGTTIITITSWYDDSLPIAITFVENVEIDIHLNKFWIDNFETQSQKTTNPLGVEYNTLANSGSIKIIDKDKKLYEYSKMGYLNVDLYTLTLFINGKQAQEHISLSSPNYSSNYTLSLELTNEIAKWNDIVVPSITYSSATRLYNIIEDLLTTYLGFTSQQVIDLLSESYVLALNSSNQNYELLLYDYCRLTIRIPSGLTLESDTLLNQLNKVCMVAQIGFYYGDNGELKVRGLRPVMTSDEKIINVPIEKQYDTFEYSIITDNRYDAVSFDNDTINNSSYRNVLKLSSNEILDIARFSSTTTLIKEKVSNSILKDYSRGIKMATMKIFPSDFYYTDNTMAKNWNNGDIIEINDILRIEDKDKNNVLYDNNNMEIYFRVVDRKIIYEGQVLIELALQEIKN